MISRCVVWVLDLMEEVFREIWSTLKLWFLLLGGVTLLLIGIGKSSWIMSSISSLLIIMTLGALISDRGIEDTTYIINGKRVLAKTFLKVKKDGKGSKAKVKKV